MSKRKLDEKKLKFSKFIFLILIFKCKIESILPKPSTFRILCYSCATKGVPKLLMLLLKKFKSGSNDLSVEISSELPERLNFNDSKLKTSLKGYSYSHYL